MRAPAGSVVAWWESHSLEFGTVRGEEKGRVIAVVAGGREVRIPKGRALYVVEPPGPPPAAGPEGRHEAGARAAAARQRTANRAQDVDVSTLWELTLPRAATVPEGEFAELALGEGSPAALAAVSFALAREGIRFQRRHEGWEPRPAPVVEAIVRQRAREEERRRDRGKALEAFSRLGAGESFAATGSEWERRFLDALEEIVLGEEEVAEAVRRLAGEAVEAFGRAQGTAAEGAFRVLRATGRFPSDDENLAIHRYRLRVEFPQEVTCAAEARVARGFDRGGREDLTGVDILTVDGPRTREIDDGLSVERRAGGGWTVGIHIADPSSFVLPGDPLDDEARLRATSFYFPDRRLPMLPPEISERAASLVPGEERPALSLFAEVTGDGEIVGHRLAASVVRPRARLDYDGADGRIASGSGPWAEVLGELAGFAQVREARRERAGAISVRAPESEIYLDAGGRPVLERRDPTTPAHRAVAEAMILAGALVARHGGEAGIPLLYRRQPPPTRAPEPAAPGEHPLVAARRIRRGLRRGEVGLEPGPHHGLGLEAYAQATSPLRRYADLVNHRQVLASLRGERPPLSAEGILEVAADCDRAERIARRAERVQDRYWFLRWFEDRAPCRVEAVLVETDPRPLVVLVETLLEQPAPFLAGIEVGTTLTLRVEEVRPRSDRLVLRPV